MLVLAFATASAGGMLRDVLIGAVPPAAIRDARYPLLAFIAALPTFALHGALPIGDTWLLALDAAGLGLFAVAGAQKALDHGIDPFIAVLLGGITGVGGGVLRDVLLARIPAVLRVDLYASSALAGAAILVIARRAGLPPAPAAIAGATACFALRMAAALLHWHLPTA